MKLKHVNRIAENIQLPVSLRQWLMHVAKIEEYEVVNQNTINIEEDVMWVGNTITPPPGTLNINHVEGNFIWSTGDKKLTSGTSITPLLPKTVAGTCSITGVGTFEMVDSSNLPKCTGSQGRLKLYLGGEPDYVLNVTNDFTSTYEAYDVDVYFEGDIGLLPSPWNSNLTSMSIGESTIFPSEINGANITLYAGNAETAFAKIYKKIKTINGHVHVGGSGYMPMVSWYRVKGIETIEVTSWDEAGDELDDPSHIFNKCKAGGLDTLEFQEALIEAGLAKFAK